MNTEEILKQAQDEGKGIDIADIDAQHIGYAKACHIGIALICIWNILEYGLYKTYSFGFLMAIFGMEATAFLMKYLKLKKTHELITSIIYILGFVLFLVLWILQLVGVFARCKA